MPFMSHSSAPTTRFGGFGLTYGHFGYLPGLATDGSDVGALSDTKFACQGVTYTVGELYSGSAADNVNNRMTLFINPAGDAVFNNNVSATLLNGGTAFSFGDDPFNPSAEEYRCKTSGLTLSVGDTITVSPGNATGTPDISGTARFGWTLTARPGTIQDQDGLSGTYIHPPVDIGRQWPRDQDPMGDLTQLHALRRRPTQEGQGAAPVHRQRGQPRAAHERGLPAHGEESRSGTR